mmetsp:Transcript_55155/g.178773  ORF Transcript_55155/g.178773 Transcript_55155/m.178773 type:complete len:668 (+) Transcript_55155:484-2487(+)
MWTALRGVAEGMEIRWDMQPLQLCATKRNEYTPSLIGYCGDAPVRETRSGILGPIETIEKDEVVLCTHTSGDALGLVEAMLESWRGAASVAVVVENLEAELPSLQAWGRRLAAKGLTKIVVSALGPSSFALSDYDGIYPASVLRQVAVDAAVADLVLMADPGFVPSSGLRHSVSSSEPLGAALRAVLAASPSAFLVTSFLTFGGGGAGDGDGGSGSSSGSSEQANMSVLDMRRLVDAGDAVPFDAHVCPSCRPYAWQWMLLAEPGSLQFRAVETNDLFHPFWLLPRALLPRLPLHFHGLVNPATSTRRLGWSGMPVGLKAMGDRLQADGVQLLLLPEAFLVRTEALPMPTGHWEDMATGLHYNHWSYFFDLLYHRFVSSLPAAPGDAGSSGESAAVRIPRSFLVGHQLVEVLPSRTMSLVTLQVGRDPSLELIVMASTILGSVGLKLLLRSVPWTVHAVCLGTKRYWACALEELPPILRSFQRDKPVAIVDAYDVVFFPCSRSIVDEYRAYGRDIVWAADTTCFPNHKACHKFPNLNGGCYMGSPRALADTLEWMREQGAAIGTDDQENKWHAYNHFSDTIVLDHRQRIFTCFFGSKREGFRIENCTVVSDYTGEEVCFAHANGGTKWEILEPLLQELEDKGCWKSKAIRQSVRHYAGMATPAMIWW